MVTKKLNNYLIIVNTINLFNYFRIYLEMLHHTLILFNQYLFIIKGKSIKRRGVVLNLGELFCGET